MSRYDLVINGSNYSVLIREVTGNTASVEVNGTSYSVQLRGGVPASVVPAAPAQPAPVAAPAARPSAPAQSVAPKAAPKAAAAPVRGEAIVAPMPGHILKVPVKVGDIVSVGDTVVVMEAMKMENEIKSHAAGKVTEVRVSAGRDVGVNEVMIVIGA